MLLVLWGTSCSHDTEAFDISDKETALNIGFRLPTRSLKSGEGYEVGETYENYIDVENNNYRVYFFTSDNKFIARLEPDGFVVTEGNDYRDYSMLGKAPTALVNYRNFKIVVLANWPQYDDDTMKAGDVIIMDFTKSPPTIEKNGSNYIGHCDRASAFDEMILNVGDTEISFDADDGSNQLEVSIYYNKLYGAM